MGKGNLSAYISVVAAMLFWSLTFIWYKQVYEFYNPITTVLFRLIISSIFLMILMYPIGKIQKPLLKDWKLFVLVSFFQPFLYFVGESYGVKLVSSTLAAVLIATIPLFTSFASAYFFKERITKMSLFGIITSIIGVSLVILNKEEALNTSPFGVFMLTIAIMAAVGYAVVIRKLSDRYNSITIVTYHNIIGIFFFAPLFFIIDFNDFKNIGFASGAWVPLIELAIFGSSFAFIFFTFAIKKLGMTKANAFTNAIPVFTAVFAFFILGENMNMTKMFGIALVIGGLFLSQIKPERIQDRFRTFIKPSE